MTDSGELCDDTINESNNEEILGDMSFKDSLLSGLTALKDAWKVKPKTFMNMDLSDPEAIADHLISRGAIESEVEDFINHTRGNDIVDQYDRVTALRKLSDAGSETADVFRNTHAAIGAGQRHEAFRDYTLATLQYMIAYLNDHDTGIYYIAQAMEDEKIGRDFQGFGEAVKYLCETDDSPEQILKNMPEQESGALYKQAYYDEVAQAMHENPEIKTALRGDLLVYRAVAALHQGKDRSRAWGMYQDGFREGTTDHVLGNPMVKKAFTHAERGHDHEG